MENKRFVVKFNNGVWKAFDTHTFTDMELFRLKREGDEKVKSVNDRIAKEKQ